MNPGAFTISFWLMMGPTTLSPAAARLSVSYDALFQTWLLLSLVPDTLCTSAHEQYKGFAVPGYT
jgi:hypothetical protein